LGVRQEAMPQSNYANLLTRTSPFSSLRNKTNIALLLFYYVSTIMVGPFMMMICPRRFFAAAKRAVAHAGSAKQGGVATASVAVKGSGSSSIQDSAGRICGNHSATGCAAYMTCSNVRTAASLLMSMVA